MQIESIRTLSGPNVYSHRPVLLMRSDLGDLDDKETREFKGFNDRLVGCLPGLNDHQCSLGYRGGFVQRLKEGTYFGHVVEHVAIELATLAGAGANHGKTRHAGEPRIYNVAIEYKAEQASRYLLEVAVRLVGAVLNSDIKSLVAERVREGGTLVLNADNGETAGIARQKSVTKRKKRLFYFSLHNDNPLVVEHLNQGGAAFLLQDGWIVEARQNETHQIVDVSSVPATMSGLAEFQVSNLLAAVAACRAQNVPRDVIAGSLKSFTSYTNNPGRVNLYKLNGGHVMVDYGHNANAFEAICQMASKWDDRRVTGVIGVPGDRADSLIVHAGRVAARGFHRLIVREDRDPRGRERGAVAKLLCDAAQNEAPQTDCQIMLDEDEALHHAVRTMQRGEVVVVFYEKLESLRHLLEKYAAQPVQSITGLNAPNVVSKPRRMPRPARANGRPPLQLAQARRSSSPAHL